MLTRASLFVDSKILSENLAKLRSIAPGKEIIPMVKADGYGHGAVEVSRVLLQNDIKILGVASLAEALELRRELPSFQFEIYVFSDVQLSDSSNIELYRNFRLTPIISNRRDLKTFLSEKTFAHFPLMLKFNTGMNRLGLALNEVEEVAREIKQAGRSSIDHVMTHFACASQNIELASNKRQQENFAKLLNELQSLGLSIEATSIANSGAIEQGAGLEYSHIRPGIMMYGPSSLIPGLKSRWQGRVISSLRVRVLQSQEMKKGDPIGYGASPLGKDGRLIIAAIGYGDGFNNRYQKSKFEVITPKGDRVPVDVVGRVNMDMVQLLAPPESRIDSGDELVFWNDDPRTLDLLCQSSQTIPYEVFCQLSGRVPRIFTLA